jgi:hypothetical protein
MVSPAFDWEDSKVRIRTARPDSAKRIPLAAILAFGLTITAAPTSDAGVLCEIYTCDVDVKCAVGVGALPQDSCTAYAGEEAWYLYYVSVTGDRSIAVWDDQFGWIGSTNDVIIKTTTITETTTNRATVSEYTSDGCYCLGGVGDDTVTVTVVSGTPFPTPTMTPTPTLTPTPTPTPPSQDTCIGIWPATMITTMAKGQSPTNNAKVIHTVAGHIIDPGSLSSTAHRIEVCSGTLVTTTVIDSTGTPSNTAGGNLSCHTSRCIGVVNVTEKYQSISADGRDKDSITFIPK